MRNFKENWKRWWWCRQNFLHDVDVILDKALNDCLNFGIRKVISRKDDIVMVHFNGDSKYAFYNGGRYFTWLEEGEILFSDGSTYGYKHSRPHAETMYKFKKALEQFNYSQGSQEKVEKYIHESLSETTIDVNETK